MNTASPAWAGTAPLVLAAFLYLILGLGGWAPAYRWVWFWSGSGVILAEAFTGHWGALAAAAVSAVAAVLVFKPRRGKHRA